MAKPSTHKPVKKSRAVSVKDRKTADAVSQGFDALAEPVVSYNTRIRNIGNSKGIILNSAILETAGLNAETDIVIHASKGIIQIIEVRKNDVNTDLSTWDEQFKTALKKGFKPENDLFEGIQNEFDLKEW